ncbi:MAG: hypothetical protein CVU09_09540 [Bacteroidetes bacterium HGW-Bacteroidetes-4]|jgi:hypothetical protein|nr:MAG: hypothetical protein CVU09_09540 [Bacteroidetes bacterium HGW-Bacteroidetes-4]
MAKLSAVEKKTNSPDFLFHCPGCGYSHGVWTTRLPGENHPLWQFNGDINNPTISPSLLVRGQFICHSFIRSGKIQFLNDCTHHLAGQTIDMQDV